MLKRVKVRDKVIYLMFDLKNQGKFRLKKLSTSEIQSTYNPTLKRSEIDETPFYLEWQISYYTEKEDNILQEILVNREVEIENDRGTRSVKPYELAGLLYLALKEDIIKQIDYEELKKWVYSIGEDEYLEKTVEKTTDSLQIKIRDLLFEASNVKLPFYILKNKDGTWIEAITQKQQFAYGFQVMIYLCIPKICFKKEPEAWIWSINSENSEVLINLFKVFSLASERQKNDICLILEALSK